MVEIQDIDLVKSFSLSSFDYVVLAAFDPSHKYHKDSERCLTSFLVSPDSWHHVDSILTGTVNPKGHFVALQVLEVTVKHRWNTLSFDVKVSLRNYCVSQILVRSSVSSSNSLLEKFNMVLVEILKRDWPRSYPTFISDIVTASQSQGMSVCANSLSILRRLHDEITFYDIESVTTVKRRFLVRTFRAEFSYVYNLIKSVLEAYYSNSVVLESSLMESSLDALSSFTGWMSINFLCESNVVEWVCGLVNSPYSLKALKVINRIVEKRCINKDNLEYSGIGNNYINNSNKFSNSEVSNNVSLKSTETVYLEELENEVQEEIRYSKVLRVHGVCDNGQENQLSNEEILLLPKFEEKILFMHKCIISFLDMYFSKFSGKNNEIHNVYYKLDLQEQEFIKLIASVLSAFYESPIYLEENDTENLIKGLRFLCKISKIEDESLFNVVLEFWRNYLNGLYDEYPLENTGRRSENIRIRSDHIDGKKIPGNLRRDRIQPILFTLIDILIDKMPRPEEVFITKNEFGEIIKEKVVNSGQLEFIKAVQGAFLVLGRMYRINIVELLTSRISGLESSGEWNYNTLNKLCWSAGCLANAFTDQEEASFFTDILRELLYMCESRVKREDKAMVASNILFLVGQFEKFLLENYKFTKTVVKKLFEFMQEKHEGVVEMSCDTFLKVSKSAGKIIVSLNENNENYLIYLLKNNLKNDTSCITHFQKRIVYEGFFNIINCINYDNKTAITMLTNIINSDIVSEENIQVDIKSLIENPESLCASSHYTKSITHVIKCYAMLYSNIPDSIQQFSNFNKLILNLFERVMNIDNSNGALIRNVIIDCFSVVVEYNKTKSFNELSNLGYILLGKIVSDYKNKKEPAYLKLANEIVKKINYQELLLKNKKGIVKDITSFSNDSFKNNISNNGLFNNQQNFNSQFDQNNYSLDGSFKSNFNNQLNQNSYNLDGSYNTEINDLSNKFTFDRDMFCITNLIETSLNENVLTNNPELFKEYTNLIHSLLLYSKENFLPTIFNNNELFLKFYRNLEEGIMEEIETSEMSLRSIIIIMKRTFQNKNYFFWQKYTTETIENLLAVLFDKDKSFTIDLQCKTLGTLIKIILNKQMINLKQNQIQEINNQNINTENQNMITEFLKNLFKENFKNLTNEAVDVFIGGLFLLADENHYLFLRDHIIDFRVKIHEFYGNEDIEDEINLIKEREKLKNEIQKY